MIALADTSAFVAREQEREPLSNPGDIAGIAVSVVTVGELRLGVLLARDVETRARRMAILRLAESLEPIPVDELVSAAWAELVATLRQRSVRMPLNDSWIAATALAHGLAVLTQDADYDLVPGLVVKKA